MRGVSLESAYISKQRLPLWWNIFNCNCDIPVGFNLQFVHTFQCIRTWSGFLFVSFRLCPLAHMIRILCGCVRRHCTHTCSNFTCTVYSIHCEKLANMEHSHLKCVPLSKLLFISSFVVHGESFTQTLTLPKSVCLCSLHFGFNCFRSRRICSPCEFIL